MLRDQADIDPTSIRTFILDILSFTMSEAVDPTASPSSSSDGNTKEARKDSSMDMDPPSETPDTVQATTTATASLSKSPDIEADLISNITKPGHMIKIPLFTWQDVFNARTWTKAAELQAGPILANFEFTFRALYDTADSVTSIYIAREETSDAQRVAEAYNIVCGDIPAGIIAEFGEVMSKGDVWVLHRMTAHSDRLVSLGYTECRYNAFFKELALRKKGREWVAADLEGIVEFLADFRGR